MSQSSLETVRRRFERDADSFAAIYRLERSPFSRWFNTTFRKAIFERYDLTFAHAGDVADRAILDIGCGSGVYSVDFARRGARRVLGLDFAENMLRLAREEARRYAVTDVCEFVNGDFLTYDVGDEQFDVTIAIGVFDYLPDPLPFLQKMASVTSGRLIVSFPGHSLVRERARRLRYLLARKGDVHFYTEGDVRRLAEQAELSRARIIPIHSSGTGFVLVGER